MKAQGTLTIHAMHHPCIHVLNLIMGDKLDRFVRLQLSCRGP